ncbi:hypothetical protein L4D06_23725 [Enterovibrio makurazakiensis]|uniref:hypothetical protein n=1 Tax=Enterovibrio makurazakiensis TaxID=2910232 RepID=UPI003D1E4C44
MEKIEETINEKLARVQLTDKYIEKIKKTPTEEAIQKYDEEYFKNIENERNTLNWDAKSANKRMIIAILFFLPSYWLATSLTLTSLIPSLSWQTVVSVSYSSLIAYVIWDMFAGFYYRYRFGENSICVRQNENRPEFVYRIVRKIALFCVVFCIISGFIFGPMIFLGAGGFALMALKFTEIENNISIERIPYESIICLQHTEKENELEIFHKSEFSSIVDGTLYFSDDFRSTQFILNNKSVDEILEHIEDQVRDKVLFFRSKSKKEEINFFDKVREHPEFRTKISFKIEGMNKKPGQSL